MVKGTTNAFGGPLRNKDCFFIAMARHFRRDVTCRRDLLQYAEANFKGVKSGDTAVSIADIDSFEKANLDFGVNVIFLDENQTPLPVRASKRVAPRHEIVLLLTYVAPDGIHPVGKPGAAGGGSFMHYICIEVHPLQKIMLFNRCVTFYFFTQDPADFLARRTPRKRTDPCGKAYTGLRKARNSICFNCFTFTRSSEALRNHVSWCHQNGHQRIRYPNKGDVVKFEKGAAKRIKAPFVLFYDFESLQVESSKSCSCSEEVLFYTEASEETRMGLRRDQLMRQSIEGVRPRLLYQCPHKTKVVNEQKAFAYHIIVVNRQSEVIETREYVGEDAASKFCDDMLDLDELLTKRMADVKPMRLTREDQLEVMNAKNCYLCEYELKPHDRVRDHDHLTGQFLGMAHNLCNLRRSEKNKFVAFSHNFSG